ncbi:hypothetical protein ACWGTO_33195, partial [Mesorhizobium sp. PL10]
WRRIASGKNAATSPHTLRQSLNEYSATLAFSHGDANTAVLAAVGYNFSLLLNWLRLLFACFLALLATAPASPVQPRSA